MGKDIEVIYVCKSKYKQEWGLRRHSHCYHQLFYIIGGTSTFVVNEEKMAVSAGDCVIIKPGLLHEMRVSKGKSVENLDIKFVLTNPELVSLIDKVPTFLRNISEDAHYGFYKIFEEGKKSFAYSDRIIPLILKIVLYELIRISTGQESTKAYNELSSAIRDEDSISSKIIKYIDNFYMNKFSLDELSSALGYNKSYLCRIFKKEMNTSIFKYLNYYRVQKSKELLAYSEFKLERISILCGFSTVNHYFRTFKEYCGITPNQYKENERNLFGKPLVFRDCDYNDLRINNLISPVKK